MNETTLNDKRQIRKIQKTMQHEMATNLIQEINNLGITKIKELDAHTLLDALGIQGLSLTISEDASHTYIQLCGTQQDAELNEAIVKSATTNLCPYTTK